MNGTASDPPQPLWSTVGVAICADCLTEMFEPSARRFRYALIACGNCGPGFAACEGDGARIRPAMCPDCRAEYEAPDNRRFGLEATACAACGPRVCLKRLGAGPPLAPWPTASDDCAAAAALLARGELLAIKTGCGYRLACDATNDDAVRRLRAAKRCEQGPLTLMASSVEMIRAACRVSDREAALLRSPEAPTVVLARREDGGTVPLAAAVAPGSPTLAFKLPATGAKHLLMTGVAAPLVLTNAARGHEPPAITLDELRSRFGDAVGYVLDDELPVADRSDDSVARVMLGAPRLLRRAAEHAKQPLDLPQGFENAPNVLAYGASSKSACCLLSGSRALLSQPIGDLADRAARSEQLRTLRSLCSCLGASPALLACDEGDAATPNRLAREDAAAASLDVAPVSHLHAHIAACLAENGWPLDGPPVLGIALDVPCRGDDGTLWGGEFALADYTSFERRGTFKPVALVNGEQHLREPWLDAYAHLMAELRWPAFEAHYSQTELYRFLAGKPRKLLDAMLAHSASARVTTSCGQLLDAAAAAIGVRREGAAHAGEGAAELEAIVDPVVFEFENEELAYPFSIPALRKGCGLPYIEPLPMWSALLDDLARGTARATMAARLYKGLARAIATMVEKIARADRPDAPLRHVALSGDLFENRSLFERVAQHLQAMGFRVLTHRQTPCNDGGVALGQAIVAAARALRPAAAARADA